MTIPSKIHTRSRIVWIHTTCRLIAIAVLLSLAAGCGNSAASTDSRLAHLTLWLDYTPWGIHVPIFAAEANGYFKREGLDVSIRLPGDVADPLKLAADNANTLGIGYMSDVVTAQAEHIPVESIGALVQHHLNCIMTLKSSGITSPRQLARKTIGADDTPADTVILDTVFRKAGVLGKVKRVNVDTAYVPMLLEKKVDAIEGGYQVWEKIMIEQEHYHVNVIQLQNWGVPDEYELVVLAGTSMVRNDHEELTHFMKAMTLGEHFAVTHPNAAVGLFLKENPDDKTSAQEALVRRSWHALIPFVQAPGVRFASQTFTKWHSLAGWMYRTHLVSRLVPTRDLFTNRFLP